MDMTAGYVSPFDERVREATPLAARPAVIAGKRVVLLDIRKNRGDQLLDRMEALLVARGASVYRTAKEIFSKPASAEVVDDVVEHADLVVEGLAD